MQLEHNQNEYECQEYLIRLILICMRNIQIQKN